LKQYLLDIAVFDDNRSYLREYVVTTVPSDRLDEVLSDNGLPRRSSWKYEGSTGSNAPGRGRGVLNTSHYGVATRIGFTTKNVVMLVSYYELVPIKDSEVP